MSIAAGDMWHPQEDPLSDDEQDDPSPQPSCRHPRLIHPDDVTIFFDFDEMFFAFTIEEQLQFAIAFKRNPKSFERIAQDVIGRNRWECQRHYYSVKFDGRFKTKTWEETNLKHKKPQRALSELDTRMEGFTAVDGKIPVPETKEMRDLLAHRMQLIPINEEIKRLLALVPNSERVYANALTRAQEAQDAERAAPKPLRKETIATKYKAARKDVKPFEELRHALEEIDAEVADMIKQLATSRISYEETKAEYESGDDGSEMNMRCWNYFIKYYKTELAWIDGSLKGMFDETHKIERPDDDVASSNLLKKLLMVKAGAMRLSSDRKALEERVARQYKGFGVDRHEVSAIEEALAGREAQIAQLNGILEKVIGLIVDGLDETMGSSGDTKGADSSENGVGGGEIDAEADHAEDEEEEEYESEDEENDDDYVESDG
ncbi:hypothetical protein PRZ48_003082 [Zasmidium cellare]|uniref:SANT domain-containing protein n=1 Tax=Zasmidium cellare TaxID=395010 RepID=A0ABR0EU06_ZASCE|nr:hypothetical protein PRZ48_003082 [Zasmidium cellare]